ncbi:hypothetical protein [Actinoplanes sp. N902-109]|uniref:hypothetical protein n=1 Tax=Actinoplanes sp. (strain N902-109) TaxID=649831 RepID=UPI0003293A56|nr:hypothetical protein [Actinoplanes sp. N902-109]AGL19529.1 hypothetical protein L083_6019 [Actinoplanes sp. N902-109]
MTTTRIFTFGIGDRCDFTGAELIDHYVSVTAPDAGTCRAVMVATFGREYADEYTGLDDPRAGHLKGLTEHARIVVGAPVETPKPVEISLADLLASAIQGGGLLSVGIRRQQPDQIDTTFVINGESPSSVEACTSLTDEEATKRVNREASHPGPWRLSTVSALFAPARCPGMPDTHRHLLFQH